MIDRAVDAMRALGALAGKRARTLANVATAVGYFVAYVILRQASNDQWYLPAGLRFASLLVMPTRLWPALYFGEVAGLAAVRYILADAYGWLWYVGALFPMWPAAALIVHRLRKLTDAPDIRRATDAAAIAVGAILTGEAVSLVNKVCSALLRPEAAPFKFSDLIVYSLGDIQGILLATSAVVLGTGAGRSLIVHRSFRTDALIAAVATGVFAAAMTTMGSSDTATVEAARLALLVPTIGMAIRHGWRGACIGSIISNLSLFCTIPAQPAGLHDNAALIMQEVFTFTSWALFVLSARGTTARSTIVVDDLEMESISRRRDRDRFNAVEIQLRERALKAEALQENTRGTFDPVIDLLRKSGQPQAAMNLNAASVKSARLQRAVVQDLYPLTLERDGLFSALHSDEFLDRFGATRFKFDLTGDHQAFALETLLAAYRILGEAIDYLLTSEPSRVDLRLRCALRNGQGHMSITLTARSPTSTSRTSVDTARLAGLRTRALAYGGSFHSRPHRMRIFLVDAPAAGGGPLAASSRAHQRAGDRDITA